MANLDLALIAKPDTTLEYIIKELNHNEDNLYQITVIVDDNNKLMGVINHGDILRALSSGKPDKSKASEIM